MSFRRRLVIIFVPRVRPRLLHARSRSLPLEMAVAVSRRADVGDWWLLYMLARNMDPLIYNCNFFHWQGIHIGIGEEDGRESAAERVTPARRRAAPGGHILAAAKVWAVTDRWR
ncbi:Innexin inx1 [Eumeta japonica]|uniref:Innexin inx1 n=1 Tax=Eumeta variegata TaxID=151549 RepID=A0A4C1TTC8_EUMVA|nr:Innexin inx1 [Eumeta japonica]